MATKQSTVDFIVAQCAAAGDVTARKMFGEYALYCEGKLVGLIGDDQLFLAITPPGRERLDETHDAPPYPGAETPYPRSPGTVGGRRLDEQPRSRHGERLTRSATQKEKGRIARLRLRHGGYPFQNGIHMTDGALVLYLFQKRNTVV